MIAQLTGKLAHKQPNSIIIDVGGVGYEVTVPLSTFYELGEPGSDISLRIHTNVREDAIQLFGFRTFNEKELFLKLTSVTGIGPKLAVTMLSGLAANDLIAAIRNNDLARLTGIPGVGRKTAERLVVELREKLAKMTFDAGEIEPAGAQAAGVSREAVRDDTVAALLALGYPRAVAERAVERALAEAGEGSIEAVLKRALRRMSR
ncbi:MAG: Holliday junction branch migration protein RuvA [Blastocatellia bacterium]